MTTMETTVSEQLHIQVRLEDCSLWATVDELPGVFATGDNLEELRASLDEAVSLYLAKPGEPPRPGRLSFDEPVQVAATAALVPVS